VRHAILRCALAIPLVTSLEDIAPRHERQAANNPVTPISRFVGRISLGRCNWFHSFRDPCCNICPARGWLGGPEPLHFRLVPIHVPREPIVLRVGRSWGVARADSGEAQVGI